MSFLVRNRILYLQFTDPAGYPPLEHSSRILAARGWDVLFLGRAVFADHGIQFPPKHAPPGEAALRYDRLAAKSSICFFCHVGSLLDAPLAAAMDLRLGPVGVSDCLDNPEVRPCARSLSRARHARSGTPQSVFMNVVLGCRKGLGRDAALCVLPQAREFSVSSRQPDAPGRLSAYGIVQGATRSSMVTCPKTDP